MADAFSSLNGFLGGLELNFANPIGLATNILLSTIVGGIVILIIVEIFAKKFSQSVNPLHAFFVSLIVSLINVLGIMAVLGGFVSMLPFAGIISMFLPIIVWIVLIKLFFRELEMAHVLIISLICYILSIFLIPSLVVMAAGFLPLG
jgi:hypothetical protein